MVDEKITFEYVEVQDIPELAARLIKGAKPGTFIPFSNQRAVAMEKNPAADPKDVGVVIATQDGELIGYFGIMPILLAHDGELSKVYWFSTWNVSSKVRGRGVGSQLMTEALKLGHDFMIVGSKPARKVSANHGFYWMATLPIATIDFSAVWRFNPVTLASRLNRKLFFLAGREVSIHKFVKKWEERLHRAFGWFTRWLFYLWFRELTKGEPANLSMLQVDRVRDEVHNTLDKYQPRFYRGSKVVNWMLAYPWVLHPGQSDSEDLDFYFSDVKPEFESAAFEIFVDDTYQGYLVFQFSVKGVYRVVKVLDVDLPKDSWILPLAMRYAKRKRADKIEMNFKHAARIEKTLLGKLILQRRERIYQCYPKSDESPLGRHWKNMVLDYTDGDMAFT